MTIEWKWLTMKLIWIALLGVLLLPAVQANGEELSTFKNEKEKISYGIGVGVARDFKQRGVELDVDTFLKGLRDELSGLKLLMTEKDLDSTMHAYERQLKLRRNELEKIAGEENKKTGEAFMAENAKKEGVISLPSGLQYKVFKVGDGIKPADADSVLINYRGTLVNGTEFDSSYRSGKPATFSVISVMPGLSEALKLMNPGSKWQIFIPSQLAYGNRRVYDVGPNSTLIFDVELLSIEKSAEFSETFDGNASVNMAGQSQPAVKKSSPDFSRGDKSAN